MISAQRVPGITMRSTFIVGFPGETEEHVAYLEEWIGRAELDRVGFFEYSREEGTPGALICRGRFQRRRNAAAWCACAKRSAWHRSARALAASARPCACWSKSGARCARRDPIRASLGVPQAWFGRSLGEAPGVDGGIYFTGEAAPGEFVDVTLEGHGPFDFFGRIAVKDMTAIG